MYGIDAGMDGLASRSVPLSVRLRLLLGGWVNQFGWLWLGFSSIFVWVFTFVGGSVSNPSLPGGPTASAQAVITAIDKTSVSINEQPVMAYKFQYKTPDGRTHTGTYKGYEGHYNLEQAVPVEYSAGKPDVAVIKGAKNDLRTAGMLGGLVVAVFPTIGLVLVAVGLVKGLKAMSLLRTGKLTYGELVDVSATGTEVNGRRVYKYRFEFAADGQVRQAVAKTHLDGRFDGEDDVPQQCVQALAAARQAQKAQPAEAQSRHERVLQMQRQADRSKMLGGASDGGGRPEPIMEPLMYDPLNPSRAVMLDALPGGPRLDDAGMIRGVGIRFVPAMILPLITLCGNGYALHMFFRHVAR